MENRLCGMWPISMWEMILTQDLDCIEPQKMETTGCHFSMQFGKRACLLFLNEPFVIIIFFHTACKLFSEWHEQIYSDASSLITKKILIALIKFVFRFYAKKYVTDPAVSNQQYYFLVDGQRVVFVENGGSCISTWVPSLSLAHMKYKPETLSIFLHSGYFPSAIYMKLDAGQTVGIETISSETIYGTGDVSNALYSYFSGQLITFLWGINWTRNFKCEVKTCWATIKVKPALQQKFHFRALCILFSQFLQWPLR